MSPSWVRLWPTIPMWTSVTGSDSVQCHTDLDTCCSSAQGQHRGNWFFPDGYRVPFGGDITQNRRTHLHRRNNANSPTGIYRCDIPTCAVHVDKSNSVRDRVYVGLYTASGGMLAMIKPILVSP